MCSSDPSERSWEYYTTEWKPAERATIVRDGVNLSFDHLVPAGIHKDRIVIRDNRSGAVGSLTVPLASS